MARESPEPDPPPPNATPPIASSTSSTRAIVSGGEALSRMEGEGRLAHMAGPTYSLQGKTAVITGAARGIGADAARRIAARGARVSLIGLEPDELRKVARSCGDQTLWFEADVTDADALKSAIDTTAQRAGGIDVVIANAGIAAGGPMRYMAEDSFRAVIEVNVVGVWRTLRFA